MISLIAPEGLDSVICGCRGRQANETSFEVNWSECGIAWPLPSGGVNALPSEIDTLLCFSWPWQPHAHVFFPGCAPKITALGTQIYFSTHLPPRHTQSVFTGLFQALAIPNWKKFSFSLVGFWRKHSLASSFFNPPFLLVTPLLPVLRCPVPCADLVRPRTNHLLTLFLYPWEKNM